MLLCVPCGMKKSKKRPTQPLVATYNKCDACGKRSLVCAESSYGIKPDYRKDKDGKCKERDID